MTSSKKEILKLTETIYKIIAFFPEREPLKEKIKERALEIMEKLILVPITKNNPHSGAKEEVVSSILKDIKVLESYLKLAQSLGWLDSFNFLILKKEYEKLIEEIIETSDSSYYLEEKDKREKNNKAIKFQNLIKLEKERKKERDEEISERQREILEFLKKEKRAQVSDIKKIFPKISKRTIRRDFESLMKKEKIIRCGEWNQAYYKLKEE